MRANAVILFAGDSRREESCKGLPPRFLRHLHARIASMLRSIDTVDVFIADELSPGEESLAAKVDRAIAFAFDRGYERVVLLAGDVAGLTREHVRLAIAARDAAIGRSPDGGFYLLALSRRPNADWQSIRWCGKHTVDDLLLAIGPHQIAFLSELGDIDSLNDALRVLRTPRLAALYGRLQSLLRRVFETGDHCIRSRDALPAVGLRAPPVAG